MLNIPAPLRGGVVHNERLSYALRHGSCRAKLLHHNATSPLDSISRASTAEFVDLSRSRRAPQSSKLVQLIRKGIIPQARQSLESALAGYTVDKVDFLTLLDNQVTLLNWEIKDHRELANYEQNLARLENVIGQRIY